MDHGNIVGRPQPTCVPQDALKLQFDFVVTKRSIYTPWSGPDVLDPTPVADHDRNGFIISEINNYRGNYMYIVTWKDKPHLLVSVRPQKIRDYVSARSYEEWNMQKFLKESRSLENFNSASGDENKENEEKDLKLESKSERKRKRARKPSEDLKISYGLQTGLDSANLSSDLDQTVLPLSQQASLIPQSNQELEQVALNKSIEKIRPNHQISTFKVIEDSDQKTQRNSNRTLIGQTTADEEQANHSDIQFKRSSARLPRPKIEKGAFSVASSSDTNSVQESIPPKPRTSRSSSRSAILDSQQVTKSRYQDPTETRFQNSLNTSRLGSGASMPCDSHRETDKINTRNTLARGSQKFVDSFFKSKLNPRKITARRKTMSPILQQKNSNESGFEVEDIQDERWEQDGKGNAVLLYLVKWKGSHIKTWEPEENIGSDVLTKYTANKIFRSEKKTRRSSVLRFPPTDIEDTGDGKSNNDRQLNFKRVSVEVDTIKTTRKAKQKAMSINMFEPEVARRKRGGIPGDLGDEDEPFQVTSSRRRKFSSTKR